MSAMHTSYLAKCPIVQSRKDTFSELPEAIQEWLKSAINNAVVHAESLPTNGAFDQHISWVKENYDNIVTLNSQQVHDDGRMLWFIVRNRCVHDAKELDDREFQYEVELKVKGFPEQTNELTHENNEHVEEQNDDSHSFDM